MKTKIKGTSQIMITKVKNPNQMQMINAWMKDCRMSRHLSQRMKIRKGRRVNRMSYNRSK